MKNNIEYTDPIDSGGQASTEDLRPLWFGSEELPPSITDKS